VLTKSGPVAGTRDAFPNSLAAGRYKAGGADVLQLDAGGVAIGDPIGPVPIVGIAAVLEKGAGVVNAVNQGNGKSGRDSFDQSRLEVAKNGVGQGIPVAPEPLSAAEGQIVDDTAREAVIEI